MSVFILGAGAASTYGCPLTKDLLRDAVEFSKDDQTVERIKEILYYVYPDFKEEYRNYPNIEEFLSFLDVWKEFNSKVERRPNYSDFDIEQVRKYVIRLLAELLDSKLGNIKGDHPMLKFAEHVLPNDIIITFNWDLGIEWSLNLMDQITDWRYRLPRRPTKGDVVLLKAHGSIDWFKTEDISFMRRERWFFLDDVLGQISVINSWDIPRYKRRKELIPFVIPPTFGKKFQQGEIIGIWADIYRALLRANNIYIFGYSLPQTDLHARFTLRAAIQNNPLQQDTNHDAIVRIFNPDEIVRHTFTELLGSKLIFKRVCFEDIRFDVEITR